jgi:hypothetical protein
MIPTQTSNIPVFQYSRACNYDNTIEASAALEDQVFFER